MTEEQAGKSAEALEAEAAQLFDRADELILKANLLRSIYTSPLFEEWEDILSGTRYSSTDLLLSRLEWSNR